MQENKYLDKEAIRNSLTEQDIIMILMDLGSDYPKHDNDGNLIFQTVCHNVTQGSYKLYYYKDTKTFHCYTSCGTCDIYELVLRAKRIRGITLTFYQSVKYVASITGKLVYGSESIKQKNNQINDWDIINRFNHREEKEEKEISPLDENILDLFTDEFHPDWLNDNITESSMLYFGIKFSPSRNCIIIPHRYYKTGQLIGIRGRFLGDNELANGMKYAPITVEGEFLRHPLSENLYGLHENISAIKRFKKIIVYEAEKSVLQNHGYFGCNDFSVALCGSNLTDTQIKIIRSLGVEEIILALDKEYTDPNSVVGQAYLAKLISKVAKLKPYMRCSIVFDRQNLLNLKDSPTDQGKETLLKLLDDKITVTDEDLLMIKEGIKVK